LYVRVPEEKIQLHVLLSNRIDTIQIVSIHVQTATAEFEVERARQQHRISVGIALPKALPGLCQAVYELAGPISPLQPSFEAGECPLAIAEI
jgi:hypothetical protein